MKMNTKPVDISNVDEKEKKLNARSNRVNEQLHIFGLIIAVIMGVTSLVLVCGVGYNISTIYHELLYRTINYDTMVRINTTISWTILAPITIMTTVMFYGIYKAESPFSRKNVIRIRIIAVLLVLLSVAPITIEMIAANLCNIKIGFSMNLMYIFIGIIIFCISFVFEHGLIIQQKTEEIINVQEEVILAFAEITEAKSGQTGQHVKRVSEYCRLLAEGMGMTADEVENLRVASMMHDVGKLMIPNEILEKDSSLSKEEYEIMKTHVTEGEMLLHNASGEIMHTARLVALQHHEQWNGGGYLGMKGEEISLQARIVAVADVFDALVSARSYKSGWEPNRVYSLIVEESGKKFDPEVVKVFVGNYSKMIDIYNKFNQTSRAAKRSAKNTSAASGASIEEAAVQAVQMESSSTVNLDLRHLI